MKTKRIFAAMLGVALALGLTVLGCNLNGDENNGTSNGNTNDDTKSLKITGITTLTGSVTVMLTETMGSDPVIVAGGTAPIENGEAVIPLKNISEENYTTEWTGSGEYYIMFWNTATPSGGPSLVGAVNNNKVEKINFSEKVTTVPFSQLGMTNADADPLLGTWRNAEDEIHYMQIYFAENNEGFFEQNVDKNGEITLIHFSFTYSFSNAEINFEFEAGAPFSDMLCEYELSNGKLTINDFGDSGNDITFSRIGDE
jgi:hypothetical protein